MRCIPAHDFNVSKAMAWRSAIADDPPYQRESSVWTLEKRQLFIDSLLNGYDVPKIYLHDLRGKHPTRVYAVVDGKQRLTAIWRFLANEFPLAADFRIEPANLPDPTEGVRHPSAGDRYSDLDPAWQRVLRTTHLAVVLIQNATEEDIEDLFSRLNNGEPLNAAEKRNAIVGDATRMIRRIARHRFFTSRVRFTNARYHHHDAAARMLLIESAAADGAVAPPDVRSRSLDAFVRSNRKLPAARRRELTERIERQLDRMCLVFCEHDPLLTSQASPQLYHLLVRMVDDDVERWAPPLRAFLEAFQDERRAQLQLVETEQDVAFREFSALMHTGANEARSLARRLEILVERLQRAHPELPLRAPVRGGPARSQEATRS